MALPEPPDEDVEELVDALADVPPDPDEESYAPTEDALDEAQRRARQEFDKAQGAGD